eukprot:214404_1
MGGVRVGMSQGPNAGYVGYHAISKRGILDLYYPIKHGIITDWYEIEKIWDYIMYNELRIQPEEHPILMINKPLQSKTEKINTAQIMFEICYIPALYLANSAVMALLGSGERILTGIILESGYETTYSVPIYQGYVIKEATNKINLGGKHITDYLTKLINENGYSVTTMTQREIVKDIKEQLLYVNVINDNENNEDNITKEYELPDGQIINIATDTIIKCTESLFKPFIINKTCNGIQDILYDSIVKLSGYNVDIMDMCNGIILCGGNTMFSGIDKRLEKDINKLFNDILLTGIMKKKYFLNDKENMNDICYKDIFNIISKYLSVVKCAQSPERKYLSWIGGSIFGSMNCQDLFVNRKQYNECGSSIVYRNFW